jgi:hypothetical protein
MNTVNNSVFRCGINEMRRKRLRLQAEYAVGVLTALYTAMSRIVVGSLQVGGPTALRLMWAPKSGLQKF